MNKHLAPLLGMALLLTACSPGGNEATPENTATESPSASAAPAPSVSPTPTATTAVPTPSATPKMAPAPTTPPPAAAPTQAAPPPAAAPANPQTSPRGNLVKQVGELAGIKDATGEYLAAFTVNDIIVDIPCTDELASAPENGHFVALDVSVETSPNMLNSDLIQQFSMSSSTFQAIGPDGTTSNAGTDSAATIFCLDNSVLLPSTIGPGEKANGLVLLDVQQPSGTLIYQDYWTDSAWEYTY